MKKIVLLILSLTVLMPALFALELKEADVQRDKDGVIIQRDQRLKIASDRKVYQIAANVIRTEELSDYLERRMNALDEKILLLETRVADLEGEVEEKENNEEEKKHVHYR